MSYECRYQLNSNDYTDFIFRDTYFANRLIGQIDDYCVTRINDKWSVISVNNDLVGAPLYENFGYSVYPDIYGLSDLGALNASGVLRIREQPVLELNGSGTMVAIIDTGINWRHRAFVRSNNTTKISVIWDQDNDEIYNSQRINAALAGGEDIPGDEIGHGTFMAGIACGNADSSSSFSGVAPMAELVIVKLRQAKENLRDFYSVKSGVPAYSEVDIMRGVQFASEYAAKRNKPLSLVIGMGTSLCAHNGFTPLSEMLLEEAGKIGTCVTASCGNEGNERLHYHGVTQGPVPSVAELKISSKDKGLTANIWSKAPYLYTLEIVSPSGQTAGRIPVRNNTERLFFIFENTTVYVYSRRYEGLSGSNLITVRFKNAASGIWSLRLYSSSYEQGEFDIWVMNRSFLSEDTYFLVSSPDTTITDPANASGIITVSAYDYRNESTYIKNSRGYNWYEYVKPDFAAPGVDIIGPSPYDSSRYEIRSGSSVAAAFFAGIGSMLLEYGIVKNNLPYIRTSEIKSIIISGCDRKPGITYPNNIWGYGSVNIYNALEKLRSDF